MLLAKTLLYLTNYMNTQPLKQSTIFCPRVAESCWIGTCFCQSRLSSANSFVCLFFWLVVLFCSFRDVASASNQHFNQPALPYLPVEQIKKELKGKKRKSTTIVQKVRGTVLRNRLLKVIFLNLTWY